MSSGETPELDASQPPWPLHEREEGLPEEARIVLRVILLLAPVRQQMPHLDNSEYLRTCYGLMAKGMLEIVQLPDAFRVQLTALGWQWLGAQGVKH